MEKEIQKQIGLFEANIDRLESNIDEVLKRSEEGIKLAKYALKVLRSFVIDIDFKNEKTEIELFKYGKPKVYSKLIYYVKLFNIESKRPRGRAKSQRKYLDYQINKLQNYFNDNLEFYQYFEEVKFSYRVTISS